MPATDAKEAGMRRGLGCALVAVLVVLLVLPVSAQATSFSRLIVFGDSLSDAGNAFALSGGQFPPPPYAQRFSNGPVAVEYLAARLGLPLGPSATGGTDFAVGGAMTNLQNFNFLINFPPGVQTIPALQQTGIEAQIKAFLNSGFAFDPATTLFVVWGGPNDIFLSLALGTNPVTAVTQAVSNLGADVALLALAGAQHVLVPNMANLGLTPDFIAGGPVAQAGGQALTTAFNAGLAQALAQVEASLGVDIIPFDTFSAQNLLIANAGAFGFTNVTTACIATPDLFTGCQGYAFFDGVHPTTAAHALLATQFAAAVPLPVPAVLIVAGALLVCRARRRA